MEQDSPWKEAVEDLFEEFLIFFFPHIHQDIDFSKGFDFLDKELQKIIKQGKTGKRYADKLVKVYLADGAEKWLLIHIEIQGYAEQEFAERMFVYNYRILDRFCKEVVSLAILTDENPNFHPQEYRRSRWGCETIFRYPMVKILDYRSRLPELENSNQPFAIIVRAYLKALESAGNVKASYSWKKRFLLELYQKGMTRETLLAIYKFIDWIIDLPEEMESKFVDELRTIEEVNQMPHITNAERLGMKRGMEKGMEKGMKKGIAESIAKIAQIKFGEAGSFLQERVYQIEETDILQQLMEKLLRAQNVSEAERAFDEVVFQSQQAHTP